MSAGPKRVPVPPTMMTLPAARRAASIALTLAATAALPACVNGHTGSADAGTKDAGVPAPVASGLPAPADVAAPPADATKTASGLATKVLTPGTGTDHPSQNDSVKVNYTGWTTDGKMFDSSVAPLQPGRQRRAHHAVARPRHSRLDRGHAAHGRRREAPHVDPRGARVQGKARRTCGHARVRHRAARLHAGPEAAGRRRRGPRRRREDEPTVSRARSSARHGHRSPSAERRRARELLDLAARREAPRCVEGRRRRRRVP